MDIIGKCGRFSDCIILNGDIINGSLELEPSQVRELLRESINRAKNDTCEVYPVSGNHDNNFNGVRTYGEIASINNLMFSNLTQKGLSYAVYDNKHPMQSWYYVDFPKYKIRMIVLNTCAGWTDTGEYVSEEHSESNWGFPTNEIYWLRDNALRFDDKLDSEEWAIIIVSHISVLQDDNLPSLAIHRKTFTNVLNAFKNGTRYVEPDTAEGFGADNVFDFTEQGAREVILNLTGHYHHDLVSFSNPLGIPNVMSACDLTLLDYDKEGVLVQTSSTPMTTESTPARSYTDISSECFDIVKIDRQKRKIILTRYGAGNSREINY